MSIKDKNGVQSSDRFGILEKQFERKLRDLILNIWKCFVKKLIIVDLDNELESESFDGVDFVFFFFIDYNLVDDGDVDLFVVLKVKLKIKLVGVVLRCYLFVDIWFFFLLNVDVEYVCVLGFRSVVKGNVVRLVCV